MAEKWLPVVGFEGSYSVSTLGRVRSETRTVQHSTSGACRRKGKILSSSRHKGKGKYGRGYLSVTLWRNNIPIQRRIHELVLESHVGPRPKGMECLHHDDDPWNPRLSNLRYGTHAENGADITRNRVGCKHGHKFTKANTYIRRDTGKRQCLACMKIRNDSRPRKTANKRNRRTTLPQHVGVAA